MDRRYIIGFCIGILLTLGGLWINSFVEDFQKQDQSKAIMESRIVALFEKNNQQEMRMSNMGAELRDLRNTISSFKTNLSDFDSKTQEIIIKVDDLKHRLGVE
jgi:uncharacterized protein YlxW (UPF0749 family)